MDHQNLGAEIMAAYLETENMHSAVVNPFFPGQVHYFSLGTRGAALAAFALYTMGNPHENQWEEDYGPLVMQTIKGHLCGNWHATALPLTGLAHA
jgi:hypothetical protein